MSITEKNWGKVEGKDVSLFELKNANGMSVTISNFGGAITSVCVPGKDGTVYDVVLGFDSVDGYAERNSVFLGVLVGRVANRIGRGEFVLDGKKYQLEKNDGGNHLHGGSKGFNTKLWNAEVSGGKLILTLESPDGDSGYPGGISVCITYSLGEDNALRIDYHAETETKTLCNLTNHSYFNLNGHTAKDVYSHVMKINADSVTAVGEDLIPTGELRPVDGTAYDFNTPKPIGKDIAGAGLGYDDNFVLSKRDDGEAAAVYSPESGISMTVKTNSPGIQLYTGNFLDGTVTGKGGTAYQKHSAFCLETQLFPDAINRPSFPSCVIEKGKPQDFFTEFKFDIR